MAPSGAEISTAIRLPDRPYPAIGLAKRLRVTLTSCHCPYGSLDRILLRQAVQRRVEGEQVHVRLRRDKGIRVQVPALPPAAILVHLLAAGALDQDAPH